MHYRNHELDNARRRMQQQLLRMGWTKHINHFPVTNKVDLRAEYNSPHIFNSFLWFEDRLKHINPTGEVYYALEMRCGYMTHIAWRCNQNNPNNRHPLDTLDAFDIVREHMLYGLPWDYRTGEEGDSGIIKIIDWEHPENNTFEFVQNWRGALNDGFGWDFILLVNAIPLCAILLEPGSKGQGSEGTGGKIQKVQAALDLAQYQLDKDFQFPVYCHALVISDGETILFGDPWMELNEFIEIKTLKEALSPVEFLTKRIKNFD